MKTFIESIPKKYFVAEVLLIGILSVLRALFQWSRPGAYINLFLFIPATYLAFQHLFGATPHSGWSVLWSIFAIILLGPIGILGTISFWYLSSLQPERENSFSSYTSFKVYERENGILMEIRPILPIPFLHIRAFWRTLKVNKVHTSYLLKDCFFGRTFSNPTNVCYCHRPDMAQRKFLQFLGLDYVTMWSCEDGKPIHFYLPHGSGFDFMQEFDCLITKACKANDLKRVADETYHEHRRKKRREKK